ncbi:MAG: hypothetical protein HYW25_00405 [Candidatus Aenigmarchaeota archaeon]|nr:hypothetical protein [Candidatus Aenigmarchaeota archaeon]
MDEMEIIKILRRRLHKPRYLKTWLDEDCEIIESPKGFLLATVDTASEGADFPSDAPNDSIGYFCTSLSLSDIAACGGIPLG